MGTRPIPRMLVGRPGVPILGDLVGGIAMFFRSGFDTEFVRTAYRARERPIFRSEWDAWGHCAIAAAATAEGSELVTWLAGGVREMIQDRTGGQDTGPAWTGVDSYNQAVGRSLGAGLVGFTIPAAIREATAAYLAGRLRIGPSRDLVWVPWVGSGARGTNWTTPIAHEGTLWVSRRESGNVTHLNDWMEAVNPGDRGTARGPGRLPRTPLPTPSS